MRETIEEYERSAHWKNLSRKLLAPVDVTCEICGKTHWAIAKRDSKVHKNRKAGAKYSLRRFAAHHKHYRHPYKETRQDLMILCATCHETGHRLATLARQNPTLYDSVYQEWKRCTGWESEENGTN